MKITLKLEETAQFALGILVFSQLNFAWWVFPALILLPDIGMLGYTINNKIGAVMYNLFHHKGLAIVIAVLGYYLHQEELILAGVILFSHAAMDRVMGYGLKYETGFRFTHLGNLPLPKHQR
jgi:hypothetical protein